MNKLIKKFRYYWLKWRFEHSSTLIYLNGTDRGLGLTTLLEIESCNKQIPIVVRSHIQLHMISHQMYLLGQLGLAPSYTEDYISKNLVLVSGSNYRGRRFKEVLIDNACTDFDVDRLLNTATVEKIRGFVTN